MWGINVKVWNTISSIKEKTGDSKDCEACTYGVCV